MQIQDLFAKPIDRPINGVIKADQRDAESVWQELDEYVATKQVTEYLRKFFDAYLATAQHPNDPAIVSRMGVWVSGFFGSGKSHFIKILSYLLSNMEAAQPGTGQARRALDFFQSKLSDPMLLGDMRRAVAGQTDVILFNIDSKADAKNDRDAILQVFLRVFNEMQGLSGDAPHVADMERHLISKGAFDAFKQAFKARVQQLFFGLLFGSKFLFSLKFSKSVFYNGEVAEDQFVLNDIPVPYRVYAPLGMLDRLVCKTPDDLYQGICVSNE